MTDNETKKVLECRMPFDEVCVFAYDLINRLESENSNLTSNLSSLQNDLTSAKAEVERLKYLLEREENKNDVFAKQFYKLGAKEFAERLKKRMITKSNLSFGISLPIATISDIDDLLKEMVGEK